MPETKEEIFQTSEATPLEIPASLTHLAAHNPGLLKKLLYLLKD